MIRQVTPPRIGWEEKVEAVGMNFHTLDGQTYWDESVHYVFRADEVDMLEAAANEIQRCCVEAAETIIRRDWFHRLGIPEAAIQEIKDSWERDDFSIYGRFDFSYDGCSAPKLLEYNADTPTSLLEASVVQWAWLQEVSPKADQFNSIHERLIAAWGQLPTGRVHFAAVNTAPEDAQTALYLRDTCQQAGKDTVSLDMLDIGFDSGSGCFVDADNERIEAIFKLYPWEWMWREEFARHLPGRCNAFVEPVWKMLWSNKGLLPILWELFPGHPNLLPCYESPERLGGFYVKKPKLGREGANITLFEHGVVLEDSMGDYGAEGFVYQALAPRTDFHGQHPVLGLWMIDGESAGMGIREDRSRITGNRSRFVPHLMQ